MILGLVNGQLKTFKHPPRLMDEQFEKHIRPIYQDLSNDDLLTRCLGGHTQNANDSFNSTVWRMAPKHLHSGLKIVEIASYCLLQACLIKATLPFWLPCSSFSWKSASNAKCSPITSISSGSRGRTDARPYRAKRLEQTVDSNNCTKMSTMRKLLYGAGIAE